MILKFLRVRGASLAPLFQDGDFVLASRLPLWFRPPRVGEVVVFTHPAYGRLMKRVVQVLPDHRLIVRGTDIDSVDSRTFGAIGARQVEGVVIAHIPRPRSG